MKFAATYGVVKDLFGNPWSVSILCDETTKEPVVRFVRPGKAGHVDYCLATLLACHLEVRNFSIAGPEVDDPAYPMPEDFPRRIAIWTRDTLPATVGEFIVVWIEADPQNPFGGRW